jgi:serine/threonine protein kinase
VEGLIWRQLVHSNILPFIGVDEETFKETGYIALASPWMDNGLIMDYICSDDYDPRSQRHNLVCNLITCVMRQGNLVATQIVDVALGLHYLHKQGIAHGDLHAVRILPRVLNESRTDSIVYMYQSNVFITSEGSACLADFGLTVICDRTCSNQTSTANAKGATRWLAPELFSSDPSLSRKTSAGDVFAFGRLCLAVRTCP